MATDWKHYMEFRPGYPDSMWECWLDYHQGPLEKVHDIGAGSGNGAEGIISRVKVTNVVLTDPKFECGQEQRARFEGRYSNITILHRTARGEDPWDVSLGLDQVDFVMCCESLHWTRIQPTLEHIAEGLRSGGTFAAVIYAPFPFIKNNEVANTVFHNFTASHFEALIAKGLMNEDWTRSAAQLYHGIDCVSLPDNIWKDVQRIFINLHGREWASASKERTTTHLRAEYEKYLLSDLGTYERITMDNDKDWQRPSTSLEWIRQMLISMRCGFGYASWTSPVWLELEASVSDGKIDLEWEVEMILARKK